MMSSKTTTNGTHTPVAEHPVRRRRSHLVAGGVAFVMLSAAAVVLLLSAASMLLAEWIGSSVAAAAILGGVLALLAWCVYMIWMRRDIERISEQIQTVYSAAAKAGRAYDWAMEKIRFLRLLLAVIRSKW